MLRMANLVPRALNNTYLIVSAMAVGLATLYIAAPLWLNYRVAPDPYLETLAAMTTLAIATIVVGFKLPLLDARFRPDAARLHVSEKVLQAFVWGTFITFAAIVIATAPTIPFLSAIAGASDAQQLSVERGNFLKTRMGWQSALPYISAAYVAALLPYATARLFVQQSPWRFAGAVLFVLYTMLALEKSNFFFALAPLLWLSLKRAKYKAAAAILVVGICLLYVNTLLARGAAPPISANIAIASAKQSPAKESERQAYHTAQYAPESALDHILWRLLIIPVVTASDGLRVFDEKLEGRHLWGATSSFVAKVTGQQRVNLDAEIFAHQYGRSFIGRSNAVYLVEAFVNFGWLGVVAFSLFVGQALRWFQQTVDESLQALWPLFCSLVFGGGLLGTLLSNGYLAVFLVVLWGSVGTKAPIWATRTLRESTSAPTRIGQPGATRAANIKGKPLFW